MTLRNFPKILSLLFLLIVVVSCKKKDDSTDQVDANISCTFLSPAVGTTFNFGDVINFTVKLTSNLTIEKVDVYIASTPSFATLDTRRFFPNQKDCQLSGTISLSSYFVQAGNYSLKVVVRVNGQDFTYMQGFSYAGCPRVSTGLVFFAPTTPAVSGPQFKLYSTTNSIPEEHLIRGDFGFGGAFSADQKIQVFLKDGGIKTLGIWDGFSEDYQASITGTGSVQPVAYYNDFQNSYIACSDGNIQGIDYHCQRFFQTGSNQYLQLHHIVKGSDFVLADFYKPSTGERKLGTFFYPSGVASNELLIDFDVCSLMIDFNGNLYVIGNRNQHGLIYQYDRVTNSLQLLRDHAGIEYRSAIWAGGPIILCTDQGIWKYTTSSGAVNTSSLSAWNGVYDETLDVLYLNTGYAVHQIAAGSFQDLNQYPSTDSITGLCVVYNR